MKPAPSTVEPRRALLAAPPPAVRPAPPVVTKTGTHSQPADETRKAFLLRISPELWKEIEAWSQAELRSVNGQIEFLLRQAVSGRKRAK